MVVNGLHVPPDYPYLSHFQLKHGQRCRLLCGCSAVLRFLKQPHLVGVAVCVSMCGCVYVCWCVRVYVYACACISGGWWEGGRKDCELGFHWPACTVSGVWWHKDVRIKLFQGVLVNCKKAGRDNYVNKIDTIHQWQCCTLTAGGQHVWTTRAEGKDAKPISQIRPTK